MEFLLNPLIKKEEWNRFVLENGGSFLQSYEWGEFQKKFGREVFRFCVKNDNGILLAAQAIRHALPLKKSYVYVPYGPVMERDYSNKQELFEFFVKELRKSEAISKGAIFLKVEPDENFIPDFSALGFRKSDKDVQARETLIMYISKPEEELLAQMKQKTRYNTRLAYKHGVRIISIADQEKAEQIFLSLLKETARRQNFRLHPLNYYLNMMEMFLDSSVIAGDGGLALRLFFAQYQKKIVAGALVGFFGKRATYLHGASLPEYRNIMAPHLLHWEIIKAAKHLGFFEYDFWGIVTGKTDPRQKEKWEGFSKFKMGFGGRTVEYPGAYDLVFSKLWYNVYEIARKFKI